MSLVRTLAWLAIFSLGTSAALAAGVSAHHKHSSRVAPATQDLHRVVTEFNGWLDTVEQSGQVSGLAAGIVKDDHVLLLRGIGYADADKHLPVKPDTVFRLASLSKAFASALTAMLVDEGMLHWDTRVNDVLPTFELHNIAATDKLTVRDILSQRVGLPHNTYDRLLEREEPYPELVEKLRDVPMTCDVGDCYGYQNITFALIGDITYAVSGDFFYHEVEKRIFHPLNMRTATYGRDALEATRSWARPHTRHGHHWVPIPIKEAYYHVPPAAGVNASVRDMSKWLIAQMGERPDVLSPALLKTVHTPLVETPHEQRATAWRRARLKNAEYALGWRVYNYAGHRLIYHAGAVQGYRAMIAFFPEYRFGAVMLWNCGCALPSGLMPMLLDRYLGLKQVDWAGLERLHPARHRLVAGGGR